MKSQKKGLGLSIVDAVEMLTTLAELGEGKFPSKLSEDDLYHLDLKQESAWHDQKNREEKERQVRQMFKVILDYLRNYYQHTDLTHTLEASSRIHTIMVLVGKAAKKLERYTNLFKGHSVQKTTDIEELRNLHHFYFFELKDKKSSVKEANKMKRLWNRSFGSRVLQESATEQQREAEEWMPSLSDLESVKADTNYELFYLRKEDDKLFFEPDMVKNIQLYCREQNYFEQSTAEDPLLQVKSWHDRSLHSTAQAILQNVKVMTSYFYREAAPQHQRESVRLLNMALMALMLAANPRNLLHTFAAKSCHQYFKDFLSYFREVLVSPDFQVIQSRWNGPRSKEFENRLVELVYSLSYALYAHTSKSEEVSAAVGQLLSLGERKKGEKFSRYLERSYERLQRLLKEHPDGPLFKALDLLLEEKQEAYDPMMMENIPASIFCWEQEGGRETFVLRLPSPTKQTHIHKATITDEFKAFLHACQNGQQKVLIINLQGRCDWREQARSSILEKMQHQAEFANILDVVTLPKNSDFYHQFAPYAELDHAYLFMDQFLEHMESEASGFYFPKSIRAKLTSEVMKKMVHQVHVTIFDKASYLDRKQRLAFIEIVYALITRKVREIVSPKYLAFSCKDGLDRSLSASVEVALIEEMIAKQEVDTGWDAPIQQLLHCYPIFIRERAMLDEPYHRLIQAIEVIEGAMSKGKGSLDIFKSQDPMKLKFQI